MFTLYEKEASQGSEMLCTQAARHAQGERPGRVAILESNYASARFSSDLGGDDYEACHISFVFSLAQW